MGTYPDTFVLTYQTVRCYNPEEPNMTVQILCRMVWATVMCVNRLYMQYSGSAKWLFYYKTLC